MKIFIACAEIIKILSLRDGKTRRKKYNFQRLIASVSVNRCDVNYLILSSPNEQTNKEAERYKNKYIQQHFMCTDIRYERRHGVFEKQGGPLYFTTVK